MQAIHLANVHMFLSICNVVIKVTIIIRLYQGWIEVNENFRESLVVTGITGFNSLSPSSI